MSEKGSSPTPALPEEIARDVNIRPEGHLLSVLSTHRARESDGLESYKRLVEQTEDEGIRYLGSLILEDEKRHHEIIDEMLNRVRSFVEDVDIEPTAPPTVARVSAGLLAETERLLEFERGDLAELKVLKKDLKAAKSYPLLLLLVKLIMRDTRKHIDILEFIRSHAKS